MTISTQNSQSVNGSVSLVREGLIAWIVLNRPEQINAINDEIRSGVPEALLLCETDPEIRVIVIRGEGPRGFCAGADIKEKRTLESAIETRHRMQSARWIESLDHAQKPIIAAIHGYCMGGGLELALACDIRIVAPNAVMSLPETALGLIPGGGGTQRLPRLIGHSWAMDMLLTGERVNAEKALALGLVTRVATSPDSLLQEAAQLAEKVANKAPIATRYVKRATQVAGDIELTKGLDLELDLFALLKASDDAKEAALAFAEKRVPKFLGR
tara:strand:- start:3673 stop:4485 length:813 start_codon:yes stop_codon:yes gene_type:complete